MVACSLLPWHHAEMGKIVNLRLIRKRKDREAADAEAAANRLYHGRSRAEREAEALRRGQAERVLNGALLTDEDQPSHD